MPIPANRSGRAATIRAISSLMMSASASPAAGANQCDNSSGMGDSTWKSTPSSRMSESRRSMSQDRESILRNTRPAIITSASSSDLISILGHAGSSMPRSGIRAGTRCVWTSTTAAILDFPASPPPLTDFASRRTPVTPRAPSRPGSGYPSSTTPSQNVRIGAAECRRDLLARRTRTRKDSRPGQ